MNHLEQILERVGGIEAAIQPQSMFTSSIATLLQVDPIYIFVSTYSSLGIHSEDYFSQVAFESLYNHPDLSATPSSQHHHILHEISEDYLKIPTCNTTADSILTWPIFQGRYSPDCLINMVLESSTRSSDLYRIRNDNPVAPGGLEHLFEDRIPFLIDKFLKDVHAKNPILDVEALVEHGKKAATTGLGSDAQSCLVLLACALGSIAISFEISEASEVEFEMNAPGMTSSKYFAKEIYQAESCYALACRRIGLLKPTILGAQCYFYSGGKLFI